jgi:hypothetical protein
VRLNASGSPIARIDHLHCKIEAGFNEWRINTSLPGDLVTLGFTVDLEAMRNRPTGRTRMKSSFEYHNHLRKFKSSTVENLGGLEQTAEVFGGTAKSDSFKIELSIEGIGDAGSSMCRPEADELLAQIGTLYQTLNKAKAIAQFFRVSRRVPAVLTGKNFFEIDFLYDLIRGQEIPDPAKLDDYEVWVDAETLAARLDALCTPGAATLSLAGDADFPFLGNPVHVEHYIRAIRNPKLITRKSDIQRLLKKAPDVIKLRFTSAPETERSIRLADL